MTNNSICVPIADMMPIMLTSLENGAEVEMTVTGNSMKPLLFDRRSVVHLVLADDYKLGDIVLFRRDNGTYVLHRICAVRGNVYDILGDNVRSPDCGIRRDQLIAKVSAFSRRGKRWHDGDRVYVFFLPAIRTVRFFLRRVYRKLHSLF